MHPSVILYIYIQNENLFDKSNNYFLKRVLNALKQKQRWYKSKKINLKRQQTKSNVITKSFT